eukprot:TRINITY_DN9831_c0_g2_i4.p2 TRINITY_DN9831_c0_g2~~TRINITY_DN9831_c0_g2_i4.p2  ORF type:complete len:137 (+),score=4.24 TRINITY_DN9831_c0_g2_i4:130-540(+)
MCSCPFVHVHQNLYTMSGRSRKSSCCDRRAGACAGEQSNRGGSAGSVQRPHAHCRAYRMYSDQSYMSGARARVSDATEAPPCSVGSAQRSRASRRIPYVFMPIVHVHQNLYTPSGGSWKSSCCDRGAGQARARTHR